MDVKSLRARAGMGRQAVIVATLLFTPILVGRARNTAQAANAHEVSYPNSEDGFQAQFKGLVQAHCSRDNVAQRLLEQLKIPDSPSWFEQNFDPGTAPGLAERYNRLFLDYFDSLRNTIESVCDTQGAELIISHRDAPRTARLSPIASIRELSPARFGFAIRLNGKNTGSWEETFIYEKGAFHFLGLGGWPFWTWEEGSGPGVFKNGHFVQPMTLIFQIPPEYPPAAKSKHIEGVVTLRAIIDKEGKVKKLELIQGDPLLVDAAMDAVKQWRYKPTTLGGNPVEADTNISVNFELPKH